ncbi:hypothetical protein ORD22_06290 [Sporosarcina sp. GW1-11]|nr:hypothetical protein [Sporosarcina sp. GW1-11]
MISNCSENNLEIITSRLKNFLSEIHIAQMDKIKPMPFFSLDIPPRHLTRTIAELA